MHNAVDDCLFCKIVAGKIPCAKVYEDDDVLAFLDINPVAEGHTLVVLKEHYPTLLETPPAKGEVLLRALRLVGGAVLKATQAGGFNCVQNNFSCAGQMIFHSHWHIIPRFEDDGLPVWPGGQYADSEVMQQLAKAISTHTSVIAGGSHE